MSSNIRWKHVFSQLFVTLVAIAVIYVYLLFAIGISGKELYGALAAALTAAAGASLILNYFIFNDTYTSLLAMAKIAPRIGMEGYAGKVPVSGNDIVGELARGLNEMSARIANQLQCLGGENKRLNAILQGMGDGLMVTDAKGNIIMVNPSFRNLFTLPNETEGKPLSTISRLPSIHEAFRGVVETKKEWVGEFCYPPHGERTLQTHWFPLLDGGEIQGVVAGFHDISDLKRLEKVRRDFVANVSHELRTPVTIIKGYAETLLSGAMKTDPERADRFLGIINTHAERLASLIKDLLALSELESRNLAIKLDPFPISGIVRQACMLLEEKALSKDITINLKNTLEMPPVMADPGRLEQVLINLLDNAIKYTPEHGSISISATEINDLVQVSVADTGVGIPPSDLTRIFERFYRVDAARSREQGGTGLGLAIVKHIVQLHGGSISVESTHGKGSTFTFTLKKA